MHRTRSGLARLTLVLLALNLAVLLAAGAAHVLRDEAAPLVEFNADRIRLLHDAAPADVAPAPAGAEISVPVPAPLPAEPTLP